MKEGILILIAVILFGCLQELTTISNSIKSEHYQCQKAQ